MSNVYSEFLLELLNGLWGIAAASLVVICSIYLRHEFVSRRILPFGERRRLTDGMRVAMATFAMSLGIFIRSAETWRWRFMDGLLPDLSQMRLQIGGAIAIVGFLCLIRELSRRLYGNGPWAWTLVTMAAFIGVSIWHRFG